MNLFNDIAVGDGFFWTSGSTKLRDARDWVEKGNAAQNTHSQVTVGCWMVEKGEEKETAAARQSLWRAALVGAGAIDVEVFVHHLLLEYEV